MSVDMKIAILALPNVERPSELIGWLKGYLEAIGFSDIIAEENFAIENLQSVFQEVDAIIIAGAAGNPRFVSAIAVALGLGTEVNVEALELVQGYYMDSASLPSRLEDMAVMPEFSYVIPNERGPIPSFVAFSLLSEKFIAATPPRFEESIEAFEKGIQDFFRETAGKKYSVTFSIDVECPVSTAEEIASIIRREVKNVFSRLDGRFSTGRGLPLTFTVYSSNPEELSELVEKIEGIVRQKAREKGARIVEKHAEYMEESL